MDEGLVINFAHRSFKWTTEAKGGAGVSVVIIGFSYSNDEPRRLWDYTGGEVAETAPANINAYLVDFPNVFVVARNKPLSAETPMVYGASRPTTDTWCSRAASTTSWRRLTRLPSSSCAPTSGLTNSSREEAVLPLAHGEGSATVGCSPGTPRTGARMWPVAFRAGPNGGGIRRA